MSIDLAVPTSPVPRMLDALTDRLMASPSLMGVRVYSAPVATDATMQETLQLWEASEQQLAKSAGRFRREHNWIIRGAAMARRYTGDTEADIRAARARVYEMVGVIELELRSTALGAVVADGENNPTARWAQVTAMDLDQGWTPDRGRWASLDFTISSAASTAATSG